MRNETEFESRVTQPPLSKQLMLGGARVVEASQS